DEAKMRALIFGASDRRLEPRSVAETGHGLPWFHGKQDLSRSTFSNDRRSAPHQRVRAPPSELVLAATKTPGAAGRRGAQCDATMRGRGVPLDSRVRSRTLSAVKHEVARETVIELTCSHRPEIQRSLHEVGTAPPVSRSP